MNLVILLTPIINIYRIISWISVLGKSWKITGEGKHTCTKSMTHNNTLWKQVNFMQSLRWVCHFTSSKFQQAAVFTLTNQNYFTGIIQLESTSNNSNLTSNSVWYFMSHIYHLCFLSFPIPLKSIKAGCITETPPCIMQYNSTSCSCQNDLTVETTPSTSNQRFHEERIHFR